MDLTEDQTWTVVHFFKENSVEAVPTNWIIGNSCYWPSFTSEKVHKAIRNHEHPNSCWESFEIRIFRNAPYDTYKEALSKTELAVDMSDVNDHDESRETRKSRSRKKLSSSSDDNSSSLDVPSPPRNNKVVKAVIPPSRNIKFSSPSTKKNGNTFVSANDRDGLNLMNPCCTCCPLHKNELNITFNNLISEIKDITKKHNLTMSVATETIEVVRKLSEQLKKMKIEDTQPESSLNSHFSFPISSMDNFEELDIYLSDAKQFSSAVIEVSKIGGTDIYDNIKRALSWVMKNSLLMQYTWHGTKEKKGLITTNFGQVILKAAEKTSTYTDRKSVEDAIKKYVRRAKERNAYESRAEPIN